MGRLSQFVSNVCLSEKGVLTGRVGQGKILAGSVTRAGLVLSLLVKETTCNFSSLS